MLSPLDQLYLDTTSKEDLLAEINDQRRQVIEARGMASDIERRLWAVEKERDALAPLVAECEALRKELAGQRTLVSRYKKRLGIKSVRNVSAEILGHMEQGLTDPQIVALGYHRGVVWRYRQLYAETVKKSAQDQC